MTAKEAVTNFVTDGEMLVTANFLHSSPYALIHEIIRQGKKSLTVVSCSNIEELDLMLAGGCLSKIIVSYYHRAGGKDYKRELDRALRERRVEFEDYSNFTMCNMLMAGALGFTFMPTLKSIMESDIYRIRTIQGENKFKTITCPFTGKETVLVPALNPDVALVHVQRADKYGNAQAWGSLGTTKWSALAAKRIIISCEQIVDHELIKKSPFLTIIPAFRTTAIVEEPMGAHPSPVAGFYNTDINFRSLYFSLALNDRALASFLQEWIFDREDRKAYLNHYIERFGTEPLERLKVNTYMSDSVNLGFKNKYWQDDFCEKLALSHAEYDQEAINQGELDL
jgi:glutaconate CoA-transferase subunit A